MDKMRSSALLVFFLVLVLFVINLVTAEPSEVTAEAANAVTIEAEDMTIRYPGLVENANVEDANRADASGGRAALLKLPWAKVVASRDTKRISKVSVRAGTYIECSGTIRMQVRVDGTTRIDKQLNNRYDWSWHSADVDIPAGRHTVEVAFISGPSCYKELWVDRVDLIYKRPVPLALGAWPAGDANSHNPPWNIPQTDYYMQKAGREPDFVHWFQSWGPYSEGVFPKGASEDVYQRGHAQVITWQPQDYTASVDDPNYSLDTILSGRHDDYIRQYARDVAAWGRPVYLRPFHEMNGDWYPYGARKNGNTPEKLVSAWRKVHQMFAEEGATNVKWIWSPNVGAPTYTPEHPMGTYYPGDAYVDWIALDGYNWSEVRGLPWYSFDEVYSRSYEEITAITQKPLMITEVASHAFPGDKAAWITLMQWEVPTKYSRVRALAWFHQNTEGALWRFDTSEESKEAYQTMGADPLWQGHLP